MKLTEQQIRATVSRMEAKSAKAPLARNGGKKPVLLARALAGDPGALMVVFHHFTAQRAAGRI